MASSHLVFVPPLIAEFPRWLSNFTDDPTFNKPQQLELHRQTIERRYRHQDLASAVGDEAFVSSLYDTLKAWGLGVRGSHLQPLGAFSQALASAVPLLQPVEQAHIDSLELDVAATITRLWNAIETMKVADNDTQLVAGTKTLHHLLPELVPPMDRAYTQQFFRWQNPQFQYAQEKRFEEAYGAFVYVAQAVTPRQYVGTHPWNTSVTKVLDNAVVGFVSAVQAGAAQQ